MNGYSPRNVEIAAVYAGIRTNSPISETFPVTAGGSLNMVVRVKSSAVNQVGTITAKLQTAIGDDWVDAKTATITAAGSVFIKLNVEIAGDQTFLPLLSKGRIVLTTTNASDSVTVQSIEVLQNL